MDLVLIQTFNALSVGSILLLAALGLALTFGLMNVINMAHGELLMVGAYVTYVLQGVFAAALGPAGIETYLPFAIVASFATAALLGWLLERLLIRHLYGRPLDTLLATWGVSLLLQQLARDVFGAPNVQVIAPAWLGSGLALGGVVLPYKRVFILGLAGLCVAGLYLYLYRTAGGRGIRACMQSREVAAAMGINTRWVDGATFALGSGLAGVAGAALTLLGPIGPSMGVYYIVDAFLVVIFGGLGHLAGTVGASFIVGASKTAFEFLTSASIGKVLVFAAVVGFLQARPAGLVRLATRAVD